jgi:hypothetical protein
LDAHSLRLFQGIQGFIFGQFLEFNFGGESSQPGGTLVLRENKSVRISVVVHDFNAAPGHRGEEFRQQMQAGHMLDGIQATKHLRRYGGVDRR